MGSLSRRYARAAFAVASHEGAGQADALGQHLRAFADAWAESEPLRTVMASPTARAHQAGLVTALAGPLGLGRVAVRVLSILARNGRLPQVSEVALAVEALADAAAGRMRAQVASAVPLSAAQSGRIANALGRRLGHPVAVTVRVDPELQAGLICHVGTLTLDSSLRRQLEIVAERLGVHAL